jgi:hypothetical protein
VRDPRTRVSHVLVYWEVTPHNLLLLLGAQMRVGVWGKIANAAESRRLILTVRRRPRRAFLNVTHRAAPQDEVTRTE